MGKKKGGRNSVYPQVMFSGPVRSHSLAGLQKEAPPLFPQVALTTRLLGTALCTPGEAPVAVDGGAGGGSSQRWWIDDTNGVPLCARQGRLVWVEPVKWWGVSGCLSNRDSLLPTQPPARRCPHSSFHQNAALGPPGDVRGMPAALAVGCRGMCGARGT